MKITIVVTLASALAIASGPLVTLAWADPLAIETIFTASDAAPDDRLGQAVAISGNIGIVGANRNDDAGHNSGSAYLFDAMTGAELFKLTASDAAAGDIFGHSVGISGNRAIVSAFSNDDAGSQSGSAYLFDVTTGEELFKLTPADAASRDFFGHGIGISGNRAIVGSHGDDESGSNSGSAYLFDVTTGEELFKLIPSDGEEGDEFGYWAAISGDIAIVGSKFDDDLGTDSGSAYLFDVTTGNELMKLTASDGLAGDEFGYAVAIEGNTAVVGAWRHDESDSNSGSLYVNAGSVYVFDVTTGEQLHKLNASDAEGGDYFGYSIGISGDTVVVGAYGDNDEDKNDFPGSAYLFENVGATYLYDLTFGNELGKLTASEGATADEFGTAVGISGNVALVGSWLKDDETGMELGQAYLFDVSALLPPGADFNDDGIVDAADLALWESSSPIPRLDVNGDEQVDGADFLDWQRSFLAEALLHESPANLDQQGAVDGDDVLIWQQSYTVDGLADVDNDGDADAADFLEWQRELTPYDAADGNLDRLVDGSDLALWDASFGWDADIDGDGRLDGDADGDGIVTEIDFLWWQEHSESGAPTATSVQVPEPAAGLLFSEFLVACLVGLRCRCWQRTRV